MLTQLISESSIPFKYTIFESLDPVQASALPFHRNLGLKHSLGILWLKETEINEAGKSLLDINACVGSSCQLESPCLVLFLWVQEKGLSIPCLYLLHFPQCIPFLNLGNASSSLENTWNLIHATVVCRGEKLVQTHSLPLEMNVRVYTCTQLLSWCLLLRKTRIFKLQLSGHGKGHRCSETASLDLNCFAVMEVTSAYEKTCPKVGANIWMSCTKICILHSTTMSLDLQSGWIMWVCLWESPVKSTCVIYSALKNGEIPFVCVRSSGAMEKVG